MFPIPSLLFLTSWSLFMLSSLYRMSFPLLKCPVLSIVQLVIHVSTISWIRKQPTGIMVTTVKSCCPLFLLLIFIVHSFIPLFNKYFHPLRKRKWRTKFSTTALSCAWSCSYLFLSSPLARDLHPSCPFSPCWHNPNSPNNAVNIQESSLSNSSQN